MPDKDADTIVELPNDEDDATIEVEVPNEERKVIHLAHERWARARNFQGEFEQIKSNARNIGANDITAKAVADEVQFMSLLVWESQLMLEHGCGDSTPDAVARLAIEMRERINERISQE